MSTSWPIWDKWVLMYSSNPEHHCFLQLDLHLHKFWWIENRNSFFLLVIWTRLAKWEVWYYCTFFYKSVRMLVNLNFYVKVFHACSSYDIHFASITKQIKLVFDISLLVFAKTNLFQISQIEICKSKYLQMFQTF